MKKRWLTIGGFLAVLTPIATVISCGGNSAGGPALPPGPTPEELEAKQNAKDKAYLQVAKSYLEDTTLNKVNQKPSMIKQTNQALLELFYPLKDVFANKFQGVKIIAEGLNRDDVKGSLLLKVTITKGTQQVVLEKPVRNLLTTSNFTDYEDEKWFEDRGLVYDDGGIEYPLSAVKTSWGMTISKWANLPINNDDGGEAAWNDNFIRENTNDNTIIDKAKLLRVLDSYAGVKNLPTELSDPRNEILTAKYDRVIFGSEAEIDKGTIKKGTYWRGIIIKLKLKRGNIIKNDAIMYIIGFKEHN